VATWNVLTLSRTGYQDAVTRELCRLNVDIVCLARSDEGIALEPPTLSEVCAAIKRLKKKEGLRVPMASQPSCDAIGTRSP